MPIARDAGGKEEPTPNVRVAARGENKNERSSGLDVLRNG
jgi:hypothetical protein